MFVVVQGLLSDDYVTQGYGTAVVPPVPPAPVVTIPAGMVQSKGAAGGYTVPPQWVERWPAGETMDEAAVKFRRRRAAVVAALAVSMLDDGEELL